MEKRGRDKDGRRREDLRRIKKYSGFQQKFRANHRRRLLRFKKFSRNYEIKNRTRIMRIQKKLKKWRVAHDASIPGRNAKRKHLEKQFKKLSFE